MGVVKGVVVGMAKERGHGCGEKGLVMGVAKGVAAIPVWVPLGVQLAIASDPLRVKLIPQAHKHKDSSRASYHLQSRLCLDLPIGKSGL